MRKTIAAAIILVCLASVARAQYFIMGAGAQTCGQFAHDYAADPQRENLYFEWAQGLMSGLNLAAAYSAQKQTDLSVTIPS